MASRLNDWLEMAKDPSAPEGLQQQAEAAQGYTTGGAAFQDSKLGRMAAEMGGPSNSARSWLTGANSAGVENGWDTEWAKKAQADQQAALKQGRLGSFFEDAQDNGYSGVVTYDHEAKDGRKFTFGDIYEDGQFVGNIYDSSDKPTADLRMSEVLDFTPTELQHMNSLEETSAAVDAKRQANNIDTQKAAGAADFRARTEAREKSLAEGGSEAAIVGGSALGGAAVGAGIGSVVPVIGTGIGALVGGGIGLVGGLLNRDELTETAARAYETTALATEREGLGAGIAEGIGQWAGVAGRNMSALSNATRGVYDWTKGDVGDMDSEFYSVDKEGDRKVPTWVKAIDVTASVGDGLLQFASPLGVSLFTAQMSAAIGGESASLALTGGKMFSDERGDFKSILTDDEGNVDLGATAAGIGKIGIDVAQLGLGRGLAAGVGAGQRAAGKEATYKTGQFTERLANRLPDWARRQSSKDLAAAEAGGARIVEEGGQRFAVDASGKAVARQRNWTQFLVPSEQVAGLGSKAIARRTAAMDSAGARAVSADDYYRAARDMAAGNRKITNALINALGEGYEEGLQAVLAPIATNDSWSAQEIVDGFLYGSAMGAGMSLGTSLHAVTADEKQFAKAQVGYANLTGGAVLDKSEWKAMPDTQKRLFLVAEGINSKTQDAAYKRASKSMAHEVNGQVVGMNALLDAINTERAAAGNRLNDKVDQANMITQIEDAKAGPSDAVMASAEQTALNINNRFKGIASQHASIVAEFDRNEAALQESPTDEALLAKRAELTNTRQQTELMMALGIEASAEIDTILERLNDPAATNASIAADVEEMNLLLRDLFHERRDVINGRQLDAEDKHLLAKAISQVMTRYPQDQAGSYQILVPQVSLKLTFARANNLVQISHAILSPLGADYDGDKVSSQNQLLLDDAEYMNARSGAQFIGVGSTVNIPTPTYEVYQIEYMSEALHSDNLTLSGFAQAVRERIGTAIRQRYGNTVPADVLATVLTQFNDAIYDNNPNARGVLLDGLADKAGAEITASGRAGAGTNEWLWIDHMIRTELQDFQESYAAHRPKGFPDTSIVEPNKQSPVYNKRVSDQATTQGQALGLELSGESLFRMFQALHYSLVGAQVTDAEQAPTNARLADWAQLYESLGQSLTTSALDATRGKDDITSRVYAQLEKLAQGLTTVDRSLLSPEEIKTLESITTSEGMLVLANLKVQDVLPDGDGGWKPGKTLSLAQVLLKRSIERDKQKNAAIIDASPELQAKYARLDKMTRPAGAGTSNYRAPEQAFMEIFGPYQSFQLLGEASGILGPHRTLEQFLRYYVNLDEQARSKTAADLKREPWYVGEDKGAPYAISNGVSAYKSVVDSILAVGNGRISMTEKTGVLKGEYKDRSDRTSDNFQESMQRIRAAVLEFTRDNPAADGITEFSPENLQRLFNNFPVFGRQVFDLVPKDIRPLVLMVKEDGFVYPSNWFYEMFAMEPAEAEMHYWRNILLSQWYAADGHTAAANDQLEDADEPGREYGKLTRRMHRLMYKLSPEVAGDGGLRFNEFFTKLQEYKDVNKFIAWVNTQPGLRGGEAPFVPWMDDVADFDPDKAGGGWSQNLQGAELREAIGVLQKASQDLVKEISEERTAMEQERSTLNAIERYERFLQTGDESKVLDGDRELHTSFQTAIERAAQARTGLGPAAMIYQSAMATWGFYPQAHTKGKNPTHVRPQGAFEAQRDAFDYVTNYERMLQSLTTLNLDGVGQSLDMVARDGGRTMDDDGRVVEWDKPTVSSMIALFRNADTRAGARDILFPKVMERTPDGRISPQLLVGKDLKSFLDNSTMDKLWPRDGSLKQDQALTYLALLEAEALKHDGSFSVQRAVNERLIARTSAATEPLSFEDIEAMTVQAYHELAREMQAAASVLSVPGSDATMVDIIEAAKKAQRQKMTSQLLGFDTTNPMDSALFQRVLDERRETHISELEDLRQQFLEAEAAEDSVRALQIQEDMFSKSQDEADFLARVDTLRDFDSVQQAVATFTYSRNADDVAARRDVIWDYISSHLEIMQRVPGAKEVLLKAMRQAEFDTQLNLTDDEWEILSRAVIGNYLESAMSTSSPAVSVALWPDADHEQDQRFYDNSFGYLADIFDPSGPLMKAAKELHRLAGRQTVEAVRPTEMINLLGQTMFKDNSLGAWTGEIPRFSTSANERLDSAAAEPGIAIPGNLPKRQAAESAAGRRTFEIPGEELLSKVVVPFKQLNQGLFDEVPVTLPDGSVVRRPLAQLNNRFARSVTVTFPGEQPQEIIVNHNVGRPWYGTGDSNRVVANSGYLEIHNDRIISAVRDLARKQGKTTRTANAAQVEISFFHPDSQPETVPGGPNWYNNIFFEGTSFKTDADRFESLNATVWFSKGGENPENQARALAASKKGKSALQVIKPASKLTREAMEANWATDLSEVLRLKTRAMLEQDLGGYELEPEFYNAVYKSMKFRHWIRKTLPDGSSGLYTADQWIAMQRADTVPADETHELWVPSDDVLRTMLGEQADQGVPRVTGDPIDIDLANIPTFNGDLTRIVKLFEQGVLGERVSLSDTRIFNRARQSQLKVRAMIDQATKTAYEQRMVFMNALRADIHEARYSFQGDFEPQVLLKAAIAKASQTMANEEISLDFKGAGIALALKRSETDITMSKSLLKDLANLTSDNPNRTGWVYTEDGESVPNRGVLSGVSLKNPSDNVAMHIAPDDIVIVNLSGFKGDYKLAQKRIDHFTSRGAYIVLIGDDGATDLRADLIGHLNEVANYERVLGSNHVYKPVDMREQFQSLKARTSTLLAMDGISTRSRLAVFYAKGLPVQEGAAWVNNDNPRLRNVGVQMNLVQTDAFGDYNVPVTAQQISDVRAHLRGFDNDEDRDFLRKMATATLKADVTPEARAAAETKWDEAFDRLLQTFDNNDGTVLPGEGDEFRFGDIIPLISSDGKVLLYRHGHKAPRNPEAIALMQEQARPNDTSAANVAIYSPYTEDNATAHTGTVVKFSPRAAYGLQVELEIPLQVFGDKQQFEWNGTKFVFTPWPDSVVLPDHGIFQNWAFDLMTGIDTPLGKEGLQDFVDNHRNAFAFLGIDFTDDMTKFFYPTFDKMSAEEQQASRVKMTEILHILQTQLPRISTSSAYRLQDAAALDRVYTDAVVATFSKKNDLPRAQEWTKRLTNSSVESQIARAMITYLMTPGARVSDVMRSGGFNDPNATGRTYSQQMPALFTRVFDNAPVDSPLRTEMFKRFNQQLYNPNNDGTGYVLHQNWELEILNQDPSKNLVGWLQFPEVHSSGDNPIKNGMTFDNAELSTQSFSQHAANTSYLAFGGRTATMYYKQLEKTRAHVEAQGLMKFDGDEADGGLWRMMTNIKKNDKSFRRWQLDSPAESARRAVARDAFLQFRKPIDKTEEAGWKGGATGEDVNRYNAVVLDIIHHLNLAESQAPIVDGWIRQQLGMPWGPDHEGDISAHQAIQMAQWIRQDVYDGYLPTIGAEVPLMDLSDLQLIYRANRDRTDAWTPRSGLTDSKPATDWQSWVETSLGSAFLTENLFDPLYLLATDGFMHTYQYATRNMIALPVSLDARVADLLMDPATNRLLVSISPDVQQVSTDPTVLNIQRATLEDLIRGQRIGSPRDTRYAAADVRSKRLAARRRWRAENNTPVPVDVTMKDFRKNGADFINHGTNTTSLARILINLRVGSALLNPALWVSMGPEQLMRVMINNVANLATGQSTGAVLGQTQAAASEWLQNKDSKLADIFARLGITAAYTTDQIRQLNGDGNTMGLYAELGNRSDFRSMIFKELNFKRPGAQTPGRTERWSGAYARWGLSMQDPTYGVPAKALARRYMEAAMEYVRSAQGFDSLSIDTLIAAMRTDPLYLQNNYPDAHKAAAAAVAQLRSLKPTPLALALRSIYEPLSEHPNALVNFSSNLFLKIPLLFTTYAMNVLTTLTGMQGFSDAFAMMKHGQEKSAFVQRFQRAITGGPVPTHYDMSEVLEGMDLSRSFIRGGLTHTGLFAFGLMAGGLGLTGEDDEERRRRRAAQLQGGLITKDPRKVIEDFRDAGAIWIGKTPVQLPWIAKQFISPVIGMERFFDNGDPREITWGFMDALGSFPLINSLGVVDAVHTYNEFVAMARDEAEKDDPASSMQSISWLVAAVGTYERMLLENSFINQLYQSWDKYDRDPYAKELINSEGERQVDAAGTTRPTDKLKPYIDEQGVAHDGFISRDPNDAYVHTLTENRFVLASGLAIFSGKFTASDYYRRNMVPKTHKLEKDLVTEDQASEAVVKALIEQGGLQGMTDAEMHAVMSLVDEDGREHLTIDGAEAVIRGRMKGAVVADSPALKGIYITYEMREAIQAKLMEEIVQEGLDSGLSAKQADTRMKRLWFGPLEDPNVPGIGDILWDKSISFSDSLQYYQLNSTYVIGRDGKPWVTGYERQGLLGAVGLQWQKRIEPLTSTLDVDHRGNTVDLVAKRNTGMRALDVIPETVPTDEEIGDSIVKAIEELGKKLDDMKPNLGYGRGGGFGGYSSGGGRSYSSGGGYANFYESRGFLGQRSTNAPGIAYINTSNPIIRRSDVRRERISGERGRLNQWQ